jgi:hypothetical protein
MRQVQVGLRLYPVQLAAVDELRGDVPRERWIRRLVTDAIEAARPPEPELPEPPRRPRVTRVLGVPSAEQLAELGALAAEAPQIPGQVAIEEVLGS